MTRATKPVAKGERRKIQEIARQFGARDLDQIDDDEWVDYVDRRHAGNKPETRERWLNTLCSFLNWCRKKPRRWLTELPSFERDQGARKPKHRRARRVHEITVELIELMIAHASPHLAGQMAIYWTAGARVSSVLYHCTLADYIAAEGREQITFDVTKNGDPVTAAVHPRAAAVMRRYLEWRGHLRDRSKPLFLTQHRKPYAFNEQAFGSQTKTAWRGMQRRTIQTIRRRAARQAMALWRAGNRAAAWDLAAAARDRGDLVAQITPHWFRHHIATFLLSSGADLRSGMDQGGWRDPQSLLAYAHDVPEVRRAHVDKMAGVATALTRGSEKKDMEIEKSTA